MSTNNEKRILIVEDNEVNQEIICTIINDIGIPYDVAKNGMEAIKKLNEQEYNIVLTDLYMPEIDGITVILEIRKMKGKKGNVPIVVLSAVGSKELKARAFYAGANDYIVKPLEYDQIKNVIAKYIV